MFNAPQMLLKQIFEKNDGIEILKQQAFTEKRMIRKANEQLAAIGSDAEIRLMTEDERAEQLKNGVFALASGNLPNYYAQEVVKVTGGTASPSDVLPFVDMTEDEWEARKSEIVSQYLDAGAYDDSTAHAMIINNHITSSFGMETGTFEEEIVFWDHEKKKNALSDFLGGQKMGRNPLVFVGHETAHDAFDRVLTEIQE